ncbi:hypothetical protein ACFW6Z_21995, partial [Streptomyces albidoflavus]
DEGERSVQFEVWAPQADRVTLHCEGATRALERDPERPGWWWGEAVALAALVAGGVRAGLPGRRTASGQARDQSPYRC